MVFFILIAFSAFIVNGEAQNVETRIHRRIFPQTNSIIEFGATLSSYANRLVIGSPKNAAEHAYYCPFAFLQDSSSAMQCISPLSGVTSAGLGSSISKLKLNAEEELVLICSNQHMITCPSRKIEQRMIGECYSVNIATNTVHKLLTPCPTECPPITADIVFLVDGSGSVGLRNFETGLNWIVDVLRTFSDEINRGNVQVGYILFNSVVYDNLPPQRSTFQNLEAALMSSRYDEGGTRTDHAIDYGRGLLSSSRKGVPKVMITVTDGISNQRNRTTTAARTAREAGITMIAVGIGSIDHEELGRIASGNSSSTERVMTVESYDKLGGILDELRKLITETASTSLEGGSTNSTSELTNCQFGTSITASTNGVYVGAPGSYDRVGTVAGFGKTNFPVTSSSRHFNNTELAGMIGLSASELKDTYFGYSTSGGRFQAVTRTWIVTGGPRYLSRGAVLAYDSGDNTKHNIIHPSSSSGYWQLGGYYGYSVLAMDLNKDGFDDLMVAEPLYSETAGYDEGIVFVYMNDKSASSVTNWASHNSNVKLIRGNGVSGSRFGMTIVNAGDIDKNGYNDVIIGAPNEKLSESDSTSGAIYIYFASAAGLNIANVQRIEGKSLRSSTVLKGFGLAIHTGSDFDGNGYPDIAVAAPLSDSVLLLRTRKLIVTTLTLTLSSDKIDVFSCAGSKLTACITVEACISAQYQGTATADQFSMLHNVTADSLIADSIFRRLIFMSTKTDVVTAADISVGSTMLCNTYGIQLNLNTLGKVNTGGFQVVPRLKFQADLSPIHKSQIMSGVLNPLSQNVKTADLSFVKGCNGFGGRCEHDLQITASYSIPMSATPLKLDGSSKTLKVDCTVTNSGPDHAFFLKVNISSGNLTINRVVSSCMIFSEDESNPDRGVTVLKYDLSGSAFRDLMASGSTCNFVIDFDFTRLQSLARNHEIRIAGKVYSNAGGNSQTFDAISGNNEFLYRNPVQYQSNLIVSGVSESDSVFFYPANNHTTKTVKTLEDKLFGGNISNILHQYTVYNGGPLGFANSRMKITWPEKTKQGHDLLYLVDVSCEPLCHCMTQGIANKYAIAPNEGSRQLNFKEFTLSYPDASEAIRSSDKLTCENTQCNDVYCDVEIINKFQQVKIIATFKPWTITFHEQFAEADIQTLFKIIPSNATVLPIPSDASAVTTLTNFYRKKPPSPPPANSLNTGAIVGGIFGGLVLLAIAIALMWKFGFFKSKYGNMTREARKTIRETNRVNPSEEMEGNLDASRQYESTADLVAD